MRNKILDQVLSKRTLSIVFLIINPFFFNSYLQLCSSQVGISLWEPSAHLHWGAEPSASFEYVLKCGNLSRLETNVGRLLHRVMPTLWWHRFINKTFVRPKLVQLMDAVAPTAFGSKLGFP